MKHRPPSEDGAIRTVDVPTSLVGAIVGPKHAKHVELERETGTTITFPNADESEGDCVFAVITGPSQAQVDAAATRLLQQLAELLGGVNLGMAPRGPPPAPPTDDVYMFVDWSNIAIGARQTVGDDSASVDPARLAAWIANGRAVRHKLVSGSMPEAAAPTGTERAWS